MGRRVKRIILICIILFGLFTRLIGVLNPLLDDQGWRQADTASMALNMMGRLTNLPEVFFPYLLYDGIQPQRVELEFPFLPYLLAWIWTAFGWSDTAGRMAAISLSVASILGIYKLGRLILGERAGIFAAGIYSVLPLAIYYGRVVMPEPVVQAFSIWALYYAAKAKVSDSYKDIIIAGILMAGAILAKLPQLMIFPVGLFLVWKSKSKVLPLIIYATLALLPPMIYYLSARIGVSEQSQFVSGIINIQISSERVGFWRDLRRNLINGISFPVMILAITGFVRVVLTYPSFRLPIITWFIATIAYVLVICSAIPFDYYLMPVLPLAVLLCAAALDIIQDVPGSVLAVVVMLIVITGAYLRLPPKYMWDATYLTQSNWLSQNINQSSVVVLSDAPPMTFYYLRKAGFRLVSQSDDKAWEELRKLNGHYLVRLAKTTRGSEFWDKVKNEYPETGPGIFKLK